jgi:hypothetical protein
MQSNPHDDGTNPPSAPTETLIDHLQDCVETVRVNLRDFGHLRRYQPFRFRDHAIIRADDKLSWWLESRDQKDSGEPGISTFAETMVVCEFQIPAWDRLDIEDQLAFAQHFDAWTPEQSLNRCPRHVGLEAVNRRYGHEGGKWNSPSTWPKVYRDKISAIIEKTEGAETSNPSGALPKANEGGTVELRLFRGFLRHLCCLEESKRPVSILAREMEMGLERERLSNGANAQGPFINSGTVDSGPLVEDLEGMYEGGNRDLITKVHGFWKDEKAEVWIQSRAEIKAAVKVSGCGKNVLDTYFDLCEDATNLLEKHQERLRGSKEELDAVVQEESALKDISPGNIWGWCGKQEIQMQLWFLKKAFDACLHYNVHPMHVIVQCGEFKIPVAYLMYILCKCNDFYIHLRQTGWKPLLQEVAHITAYFGVNPTVSDEICALVNLNALTEDANALSTRASSTSRTTPRELIGFKGLMHGPQQFI